MFKTVNPKVDKEFYNLLTPSATDSKNGLARKVISPVFEGPEKKLGTLVGRGGGAEQGSQEDIVFPRESSFGISFMNKILYLHTV